MKEGLIFLLLNIVSAILNLVLWFSLNKLLDLRLNEKLSDFLFICSYLFLYCIIMRNWYKRR